MPTFLYDFWCHILALFPASPGYSICWLCLKTIAFGRHHTITERDQGELPNEIAFTSLATQKVDLVHSWRERRKYEGGRE